jgi:hypothetical protein
MDRVTKFCLCAILGLGTLPMLYVNGLCWVKYLRTLDPVFLAGWFVSALLSALGIFLINKTIYAK